MAILEELEWSKNISGTVHQNIVVPTVSLKLFTTLLLQWMDLDLRAKTKQKDDEFFKLNFNLIL